MEEDAGVKAPVTRLRRRISIEQSEESKSPALNTPTKKRGGRRAAKPDLELIDENTPDNSTTKKTTKKTAVKDIIDTVEEKIVTPSRRSTRIKSNSSIVSETVLAVDSPRAKRAARRTSQVGSDSEAPSTPIRQTRRTRKDSTSSIEKVEIQPSTKPTIQITDVIEEEPESNPKKSTSEANENTSPSSIRKSPRLREKTKKNTSLNEKENNIEASSKKSTDKTKDTTPETKDEQSTEVQVSQKNRLSIASSNSIKDLKTESKTENINLNKSTSVLETQKNITPKRKRSKSWTTVNVSNENNFYSDNEEIKKKIKEGHKLFEVEINKTNLDDGLNISLDKDRADKSTSKKKKKSSNSFVVEDIDKSMTNVNNNSLDKNNKSSLIIQDHSEKKIANETSKLFEKEPGSDIHTTIYIEEDSDTNSGKLSNKNRYEHEDQCVPVVQHTSQIEKEISQYSLSSDRITNIENKSKDAIIMNDSCEPMDVDETVPESLLNLEVDKKINLSSPSLQLDNNESKEKLNQSKRKSSISHLNKSGNENKSTLILSQLKDTSSADINNVTKSPKTKSDISKTTDDLNTTQENDVNKRKLSLNCVTTSTPLQQKNLQKLGSINTSIITSNNDAKDVIIDKLNQSKNKNTAPDDVKNESYENKIKKSKSANNDTGKKLDKIINEDIKNTSKITSDSTEDSEEEPCKNESKSIKSKSLNSFNKTTNQSITSDEEESDHDNESEDESHKSNIIDDEAEDVGDDYESGDSQDENERQYLKDNEILEKGETLTSENDLSNDSDYEKDSFIVSSDEEDNELLEGTEDDLSMSDNELKMTAKSKKKFNERKAKEQKKASREMYESRHKLNVSNVSSTSELGKTKKPKRHQISSSESDDEKEVKTKKHSRMRLDSSHDVSLLEDKNEKNNSNKKTKRLSESICDNHAIDEKEITVYNESLKEKDPLSANVKEEPKTPHKGDSSVAFIDADNDQNVESELTKTQTEFLDPLQNSMDENDSLSSDNENIMQNYDSMLEGLNETNKIKSKTCDISLNIDKKQKKKKNTAIVDELNLTQVKSKAKKGNKQIQKDSKTVSANKTMKPDIDDDASSDSIDLHLLFSEDSNSSENIQNKTNNDNSNAEHFIPLKRTEGKTNIQENADQSISNETETSFSQNKKNKKSRKSETTSTTVTDNTDENNFSFFIDTEGTHNNSLNKSQHNKKKLSLENNVVNENTDSDAPMDVPFKKEKRSSQVQDNLKDDTDETDFAKDSTNKSVTKTPNSEKKKKKKARESQITEQKENENIKEESLNVSSSRDKKNKSAVEINVELAEKDIPEQTSDISFTKTPGSQKKKRLSQSKTHEQNDAEDIHTDLILNETTGSSKKKKHLSHSEEEPKEESLNASILKTPGSNKKKKKSLIAQEIEQEDHVPTASLNNSKVKTPSSQKKIKVTDTVEQKGNKTEDLNVTLGSAKKSKKSISSSFTVESTASVEHSENNNTSTNKRKRKSSQNTPTEETAPEGEVNTSININKSLVGSQKKKRKVSQNAEIVSIADPTPENTLPSLNDSKKNKFKNGIQSVENNLEIPKKSKNNKRKQREDDEGHRVSKVAKENSFDKVHVPRLPDTILKQLDDKPRQIPTVKKSKVVSTTQFAVTEARKRRNKPSNYLEESVYLNDDESTDRKHKKRLQKPKVLPFVPTALTSASGYTTNFKINVIPTETKFVAQSNTTSNFKDDYLFNKKIKRQGTYELYKRSRNIKLSKF